MSVDQFLLSASTTYINFPSVRPTLDLNFARVKSLDLRIAFTRNSGGSYVASDGLIKYSGVNEARFDHNPTTGESLGLLIEESRTNLFTNSSNFNDSSWIKDNSNVSSNFVAPDGSLTANKLSENSSLGQHSIRQNVIANAGETFTFSCFAKAAERTQFALSAWNDGIVSYDLINGTVISTAGNSNVTITPYPNGWYRCSTTLTKSVSDNRFYILIRNNSDSYQGDGISGVYIWGAQLEKNSFGTSYIPTGSSSVTRSADNASITGRNFSSWYNQNEGTILSNISIPFRSTTGARSFAFDNGTVNYMLDLTNTPTTVTLERLENLNYRSISSVTNSSLKMNQVVSYSTQPSQLLCVNGIISSLSKTSFSTSNYTNLRIGRQVNGVAYLNGSISRLTYFSKALPQSNLQSLTR